MRRHDGTVSGAQWVYERVKEMIGDGQLAAGTWVNEAELSKTLGIGRTPLREGLQRLQAEGFVSRAINGRLMVASLSTREAEELFAVRVVLEAMVAEAAAKNADPERVEKLSRLVIAMEVAAHAGLGHEVARYGEEFHYLLVELAGNAVVKRLLTNLREHIRRYRSLAPSSDAERCVQAAREHRLICEAIAARDATQAASRMREHIESSTAALLRSLAHLSGGSGAGESRGKGED